MGRKAHKSDSLSGAVDMLVVKALSQGNLHGWIDGEWSLTPNNRGALIDRLTGRGREQLAHETLRYKQLTLAIARVMGMG